MEVIFLFTGGSHFLSQLQTAGAGFLVCQTGNVMTMPGLSKSPAAYRIDVDDQGNTVGLF